MSLLQTAIGTQSANFLLASPEALFFSLLKLLFILGVVIYVIFSGLVVRQIDLMSKTIKTGPSKIMMILGLVHFAIALFVLLLFILIL